MVDVDDIKLVAPLSFMIFRKKNNNISYKKYIMDILCVFVVWGPYSRRKKVEAGDERNYIRQNGNMD